jgi:hypothetical protein
MVTVSKYLALEAVCLWLSDFQLCSLDGALAPF